MLTWPVAHTGDTRHARPFFFSAAILFTVASLAVTAFWHRFDTAIARSRLGGKFDLQLFRKFGRATTALLKFAHFRRDTAAYPNVQKFWAQIEFTH
ncbi:MAG: hypothetical protein H7343_00225 [Undibacterium sp.]|nr:hypothetical protein [Opitutaceae bacterium]